MNLVTKLPVLILVLIAAARGQWIHSLDAPSPEIGSFDSNGTWIIRASDILILNPPDGPPTITTRYTALGLGPQDEVDALSGGQDHIVPLGPSQRVVVRFSVTRSSLGEPNSPIELERLGNGAAGDRFELSMTAAGLPTVTLNADADDLGLTPLGTQESSIDGLMVIHNISRYFSVKSGGSLSGATIRYVRTVGATTLGDYADWRDLGLDEDDDIDALSIRDRGMIGKFDAWDVVVFSLAPGSPTLMANNWSPADLLCVSGPMGACSPGAPVLTSTGPSIYLPYGALELRASDDVDAVVIGDPAYGGDGGKSLTVLDREFGEFAVTPSDSGLVVAIEDRGAGGGSVLIGGSGYAPRALQLPIGCQGQATIDVESYFVIGDGLNPNGSPVDLALSQPSVSFPLALSPSLVGARAGLQAVYLDPACALGLGVTAAVGFIVEADWEAVQVSMGEVALVDLTGPLGSYPFVSFAGQSYAELYVNDRGSLSFGAGNTDWTPTPNEFASGPPRLAGYWADLDPQGATAFIRNQPDDVMICFADVPERSNPGATVTMTYYFNRITGGCAMAFETTGVFNWHALFGLSPGGSATDPTQGVGYAFLPSMQGTLQTGSVMDMMYGFDNAPGTDPVSGLLWFPNADGSAWRWF